MDDGTRLSLVEQVDTQAFTRIYSRVCSRASGRWGIRKNVYLPQEMIEEIKREAARLGRTVSSLLKEAWALARDEICQEATARFPRDPYSRENNLTLHPAAGRIRPRKRRRT